jgi:hypothetical protein
MRAKLSSGAIIGLLALTCPVAANAGVVFADSFDEYAYQLNWNPAPNWTVPGSGTVDLIGETTTENQFNFFPGHGGYVDLDGSNSQSGTLQTALSFLASNYTLAFDLGGNARGDVDTTTVISLGSFRTSITLGSDDPLRQYKFTFATDGGNLSFADLASGDGNIGNILDNVVLAAIPETSTWAMMIVGFAGVGYVTYRRRKTAALAA